MRAHETRSEIEHELRPILRPHRRPDGLEVHLKTRFQVAPDQRKITLPRLEHWKTYTLEAAADLGLGPGDQFSGPSGWEALHQLTNRLETERRQILSRHPAVLWVAAARHLDAAIFGTFSDTFRKGVVSRFSLGVETDSQTISERAFDKYVTNPPESVITDIESSLALIAIAHNFEVAAMRVGKGQILQVSPDITQFEVIDDAGVEEAIQLFDTRSEQGGDPNPAQTTGRTIGHEYTATSAIAWLSLRDQTLVEERLRSQLLVEFDPFFPVGADLLVQSPALALLPPSNVELRSHVAAASLDAAWAHLHRFGATDNGHSGTWTSHGYVLIPTRAYTRLLAAALNARAPDVSVEEASGVLRSELIAHRVGFKTLIDLASASAVFLGGVIRAREGADANVWGAAFEHGVQSLLDETAWRPEGAYRDLIGKRIKRVDGSVVTDIDAVATVDGQLVLIDAKAYVGSQAFIVGEHGAVRILRQRVEDAVAKWDRHLGWIRSNIHVLNLPNENEISITGMIVTPFVPFLHIGRATELVVPGLRMVSSLNEVALAALSVRDS